MRKIFNWRRRCHPIDKVPPLPPTHVKIRFFRLKRYKGIHMAKTVANVTWDLSASTDVVSQKAELFEEGNLVSSVDLGPSVQATTFEVEQGANCEVHITAADAAGNRSNPGTASGKAPSAPDVTAPDAPTNVVISFDVPTA